MSDTLPPDSSRPDTDSPAVGCAALRTLAEQDLLVEARTREVHFAPDRTYVVLRVRTEASAGTDVSDRLVRVNLPSGKATTLVSALDDAEALGTQGALLLHTTGNQGKDIAVYDGRSVRTLTTDTCDHLPTGDGGRVFVVRNCSAEDTTTHVGDLEVVDVATGTSSPITKFVRRGSLAVSPSGSWLAFAQRDLSMDEPIDTLNLVDTSNKRYALRSQRNVEGAAFVSDSLLVFRNAACAAPSTSCEVRGHVPGSGDTSYPIDTGRDPGVFAGYQISPDLSLMLTAEPDTMTASPPSARLYAAALDGTGQRLLASEIFPYWFSSAALRVFAFDPQGKYALYLSSEGPYGVHVVDLASAVVRKLSGDGFFQLTPMGGSAVIFELDNDGGDRRLRLTDLDLGTDRLTVATEGSIRGTTSVRGDQALLFEERTTSSTSRLRFVSAAYPDSVLLAEWRNSQLQPAYARYAETYPLYPVDPTGCFTIVDTDLPPGPGTRLVLLPE